MSGYFANEPGQPRARRIRDAMIVCVGVVLILWAAITVDRVAPAEEALVDLAQSIPLWLDQVYRVAYFGGLLLVAGLMAGAITQGSKRLDFLRDILLAITVSVGIGLLLVWWLDGTIPPVLPELMSREAGFTFPMVRVAVLTATVAVASPHLARPIRRFGWMMVVIVAISGFGLGLGLPGDAGGGFAVGLVAGGTILLLFGSPRGYPNRAAVASALSDLGVDVDTIEPTQDQSRGVRSLVGSLQDGSNFLVKAYGRDSTDSQYVARVWRWLWYREGGRAGASNRIHAVEHEALAIRTADHFGLATPGILAVGVAGADMALLATLQRGVPILDSDLDGGQLAAIWGEVARLHDGAMSHGDLTLDAVAFDDRRPVLQDFYASSLRASEVQMMVDVASLLFSTAILAGSHEAVDAAIEGLGQQRVVAALPYMQTAALTRSQRGKVDRPKQIMAEIRVAIASSTGTELPEDAKLRRVRPKDLAMPLLSMVAAYALISMLSDIDFAAVWDVLQDATWMLIVIGFLVGQFVFFPEAMAMLYATGYSLPLRPLVVLQLSVKWIGLAVPSAAGRVTMNTLFLRKYGVSPSMALTQGVLDGLSGFVVEAGILIAALIASDVSLDLETSDIRWGFILAIVGFLIAGSVMIVLRVERLRRTIVPALKDAWGLLRDLLRDPRRTLGLVGANVAARVVLALALWFILQSVGAPLPLVTALIATVATNLLAGLVPIPGGVGVAEAVLTSLLIFAGLGSEEAFAAAVVFRFATFYVPAAEGYFAMNWLETNDHL